MFYEVIYEDGTHSVAFYESDEEAERAVKAHHDRATRGEPAIAPAAGEPARAATRVVKVLAYDEHPDNWHTDNLIPTKDVKELMDNLLSGDVVNVGDLAVIVRNVSNPQVDSAPHETNYKMKEARELELAWQ